MSRIEEAMEKARGKQRPLPEEPDAASPSDTTAVVPPPITQPALAGRVDEHVVSFHSPRSGLTENFKQIRIMIQNMLPEGHNRILLFTSSTGDEGKTTACLNFAAAVAQDPRRRTLVVDADLRNPRIHSLLGMKNNRPGFGDLLTSDAPAASVVVSTPVPGLSAILCGDIPPNPGELFGSERARQLFVELKESYDCVIVDTPPVLPVVDTINMSPLADGVVLIVEAARTARGKIRRAVHLLNNANASIMGFLLNKDVSSLTDYYRSGEYNGG
jgi:capsular exopolysaccharide synthesis family protein